MHRSFITRDLFGDLDRLTRELSSAFEPATGIRGFGRGGFPAVNIGTTPEAVEIYAFTPGVDPSSIDIQLDRGVLSLSGERKAPASDASGPDGQPVSMHLNERFEGRFRRVVSLPDDIDPDGIGATSRDGVLHISLKRRAAAQPRRIQVQ